MVSQELENKSKLKVWWRYAILTVTFSSPVIHTRRSQRDVSILADKLKKLQCMVWSPVLSEKGSIDPACYLCTLFNTTLQCTNDTVKTGKKRMGDLEYWPRRIPCIF
jgi:hypothetical protein